MPEILIYSRLPLNADRNQLEEDLEELLGSYGGVTGGGSGWRGWNIDLYIVEQAPLLELVARLVRFLQQWLVPGDTYLEVWQGKGDDERSEIHYIYSREAMLDQMVWQFYALYQRVRMEAPESDTAWEQARAGILAALQEVEQNQGVRPLPAEKVG